MDLQFLNSQSIHACWPILALMVWWWSHENKVAQHVAVWLSDSLRHLVAGPSRAQTRLRIVLSAIGMLSMVVALMRPVSFGLATVEEQSVEADVVIALDLSKSMWAEDAAPNRLERAKYEIMEMVDAMPGYRFGLVGFAGAASVLCPLTKDVGFFQIALNNASPYSISRGGTNIGMAVRKGVNAFSGGTAPKLLVLITDGEAHDAEPLEAITSASDLGIPIVTIGFGSETGSAITMTDPQTGARSELRDRDGNVVTSRLDGDLLREMALQTNGAFVPAGVSSIDLEGIVAEHITPIVSDASTTQLSTVHPRHSLWIGFGLMMLGLASVVERRGGHL